VSHFNFITKTRIFLQGKCACVRNFFRGRSFSAGELRIDRRMGAGITWTARETNDRGRATSKEEKEGKGMRMRWRAGECGNYGLKRARGRFFPTAKRMMPLLH